MRSKGAYAVCAVFACSSPGCFSPESIDWPQTDGIQSALIVSTFQGRVKRVTAQSLGSVLPLPWDREEASYFLGYEGSLAALGLSPGNVELWDPTSDCTQPGRLIPTPRRAWSIDAEARELAETIELEPAFAVPVLPELDLVECSRLGCVDEDELGNRRCVEGCTTSPVSLPDPPTTPEPPRIGAPIDCFGLELAFPGEATCHHLGAPCPVGDRFGAARLSPTIFVDPEATGPADGTRALPYHDLASAFADPQAAAATILIAAGRASIPAAGAPNPLVIEGTCAEGTILTGTAGSPGLSLRGVSLTLTELTIEADLAALQIFEGEAQLRSVRLVSNLGPGLRAFDSTVSLDRLSLRSQSAQTAALEAQRSLVTGRSLDTRGSRSGIAAVAASVVLTDASVFAGIASNDVAIQLSEQAAVSITGGWIGSELGHAYLSSASKLELADAFLFAAGVLVSAAVSGSTIAFDRVEVSGQSLAMEDAQVRFADVVSRRPPLERSAIDLRCGNFRIDRLAVDDAASVLSVHPANCGSRAELHDLTIRGGGVFDSQAIEVQAAEVIGDRIRIEGYEGAGIVVSYGAAETQSDVRLESVSISGATNGFTVDYSLSSSGPFDLRRVQVTRTAQAFLVKGDFGTVADLSVEADAFALVLDRGSLSIERFELTARSFIEAGTPGIVVLEDGSISGEAARLAGQKCSPLDPTYEHLRFVP